jgi:1-acyl-sn-glycerol-3-phosphate acyltransferase
MGARIAVTPEDVLVSWLPLSHNMGLIGAWLAPLYFGIPLVIMSPLTFLARPQSWLQTIMRYRGTITAAPNFAFDRCARLLPEAALEGLDLSSLRYACCGAEPVNAKTMRAFSDRMRAAHFDPAALAPVYGLAENALALTLPLPGGGLSVDRVARDALLIDGIASPAAGAEDAIEIVGCGFVIDDSELRIVDERGNVLPERHVGRIEFRGAAATRGYYRNPRKTAELMDGGWLDSGDLGYVAQGTLYITGRTKDMIIRGGRHFFPYELEETIGRLPGAIAGGVAVCGGVNSTLGTERVVIFAETSEAEPQARAHLLESIGAATAIAFGAPAERIVLVPPGSIPKTAAGKIRHAAMLERFEHAERAEPGGDREILTRVAPHSAWRQVSDAAAGSVKPLLRRAFARIGAIAFGIWCWAAAAALGLALWPRVVLSDDETANWHRAARSARLFLRVTGLTSKVIPNDAALPPSACVIAVNHASYLDSVVLLAHLPRPAHIVAKRELVDMPFVGRFLNGLGVYFVERADYRASLDDEQRLVAAARENTLLFFPEGTFTRAAGLRPFHLGAFRAAALAGRPVIPLALHGTRAVLRDGDWLPRHAPIVMTILGPIGAEGDDLRSIANLRNKVRAAILGHCGEPELAASASAHSL